EEYFRQFFSNESTKDRETMVSHILDRSDKEAVDQVDHAIDEWNQTVGEYEYKSKTPHLEPPDMKAALNLLLERLTALLT
ncbi:MAG: hypothetical protein O2840_02825, partial [bacterium]|nr:hypothetical protein [bacterium]